MVSQPRVLIDLLVEAFQARAWPAERTGHHMPRKVAGSESRPWLMTVLANPRVRPVFE